MATNPKPDQFKLLRELLAEERHKPVNTTMVRVRPETRELLEQLKKQLDLPFASIVHIAVRLLEEQSKST